MQHSVRKQLKCGRLDKLVVVQTLKSCLWWQISSNDQASDVISFDFLGNHPSRIVTNYAVNGNSANNQQVVVVSFDTSVKFHTYTIKWDSVSIV